MANLRIVEVDCKDLVLDAFNARKHSEAQIKAIGKSLEEFGQQRALVVDKNNTVYAGNGTLQAALSLGWEKVDVVVLPFDDPIKCRAFAIADNRTSDLSSWDNAELVKSLEQINEANLLETVGYSSYDVDDLKALLSEMEAVALYNSGIFEETDDAEENVHNQRTIQTGAAEYMNRAIRSVMLEYPLEQFAWVINILTKFRAEKDVQSNADAILMLLKDYSGEDYPIAT
jgi:diketogulonate reductase-like aldo/keto reductase